MELIYGIVFFCGLFAGLYIGKVGELRRMRKGGKQNNQGNKGNNMVQFPPKNKKAANQ